jgi:hypothetical protein
VGQAKASSASIPGVACSQHPCHILRIARKPRRTASLRARHRTATMRLKGVVSVPRRRFWCAQSTSAFFMARSSPRLSYSYLVGQSLLPRSALWGHRIGKEATTPARSLLPRDEADSTEMKPVAPSALTPLCLLFLSTAPQSLPD